VSPSHMKRGKVGKFLFSNHVQADGINAGQVAVSQQSHKGKKKEKKKKGLMKSLFANQVQSDYGDDMLAQIEAEGSAARKGRSLSHRPSIDSNDGFDSSAHTLHTTAAGSQQQQQQQQYHQQYQHSQQEAVLENVPSDVYSNRSGGQPSGDDLSLRSGSMFSTTSSKRSSTMPKQQQQEKEQGRSARTIRSRTRTPPNRTPRRLMSNHVQADFDHDELADLAAETQEIQEMISNSSVDSERFDSTNDRMIRKAVLAGVAGDDLDPHLVDADYQYRQKKSFQIFRRGKKLNGSLPESSTIGDDASNRSSVSGSRDSEHR